MKRAGMVGWAMRVVILVGAALMLVACRGQEPATPTVAPTPEASPAPEQTLTLGDVSGSPAWTIEHFQPLADYLAAELTDFGIEQGNVVVASELETMMEYLETGQVDLYFDSPYPALAVYEAIGARPLLRRWKGGVSEYHTLLVAHRESGIEDPADLLGQMLAFDHPASTSGYLLPKAHLAAQGYAATEKDDVEAAVAAEEIGYVFAYGDENVLAWVLEGKTEGAAIPNGDYEALADEKRDQLTVIARTPAVPRHIALARPGMDEALRLEITDLLLAMDETTEGPAVLETFEETSQFDALPQGPEGAMEALQDLFEPVR